MVTLAGRLKVFRPSGAMCVLLSAVFTTRAVCVLREGAKTGNGPRKELLYQGRQPETADKRGGQGTTKEQKASSSKKIEFDVEW